MVLGRTEKLFSWFFGVMINKMTFRYLPGPDGHVMLQICSIFNLSQKSRASFNSATQSIQKAIVVPVSVFLNQNPDGDGERLQVGPETESFLHNIGHLCP